MKVHCGMLMGMLGMHLHSHITHHRGIVAAKWPAGTVCILIAASCLDLRAIAMLLLSWPLWTILLALLSEEFSVSILALEDELESAGEESYISNTRTTGFMLLATGW